VKILLTEGSGITSRQVAGRLAAMGHRVEVLTSDPLCLARFTRHVRRLHRVPPFGPTPLAWLDAALEVYAAGGFDLLFPTQEQVAVLAACPDRLDAAGVRTAVPPFEAVAAVQDKVSAYATLARLGIPQPPGAVVRTAAELRGWGDLPAYVKAPIGTASTAVHRVATPADLARLDIDDRPVLVQAAADGPLAMVQAVFGHGELVAAHANLRTRQGANGGASHKEGIGTDELRPYLVALGTALRWHGALSADVILTGGGPVIIDVNPRLVEPVNAWRSGVDLVGAMFDLALGRHPAPQPAGKAGVRTHQTVLAVLGAAQVGRGRRGVAAEMLAAARHAGDYAGSVEETAPWRGDRRAAVPLVVAALATLARPAAYRWFVSGSVSAYALTPDGYDEILQRTCI
jgi:glutathione synthase/RimK-type ligase-like ATP-grasp enzyme